MPYGQESAGHKSWFRVSLESLTNAPNFSIKQNRPPNVPQLCANQALHARYAVHAR